MTSRGLPAADLPGASEEDLRQVMDVVRALASELSGDRAAAAVAPDASLERDVGLGSLDRVELLTRLEDVFQREIGDAFLLLDTPREIARAVAHGPAHTAAAAPAPLASAAPAVQLTDAATLVEALSQRAAAEPARTHVYLRDDGRVRHVSYAHLWDGARRIATGLVAQGVKRGDTVALMLPTGLDYLRSFMGVLAAGAVAVPLYPPARLDRMQEYLRRQSRILANADAHLMIAMPEAAPVARMLRGGSPALARVFTAEELHGSGEPAALPSIDGDDFALIQYTSGSTGDPKGVLLSHANLLANIRAIADGVALRPTDVVVSWLPLYHDMGLIGAWLTAMVHGVPLALLSPLTFLARPERWLWAIHQHRASLSAAPNFAFELCVRKVRDDAIEGLDLSSWRCALNGSEPVSEATIERFVRRFEPFGFRREAMMPVYGLAESSVALAFPPVGRVPRIEHVAREPFAREGRALPAAAGDRRPLSFVSVGHALALHEIRIVDDQGKNVDERIVGRLLFRGPSCTSGYYRNPAATKHAILMDGWIDSGDLAYVSDGELYVTGRIKDLIIKSGRNLVPQEIEEVVSSITGIRKGCVVAFGIADAPSGTERLIVIAESREPSKAERTRLAGEIVAKVAADIGVPPDVVRVVAPGVVPKTPSGKIRRTAAREAFETGDLSGVRRVPLGLRAGLLAGQVRVAARTLARATWRGIECVYLALAWSVMTLVLAPLVWVLAHVLPMGYPVRMLSQVVSRVMLAISGCRIHVDGRSHVPARGPVVFVVNHASYADTPVLAAALRPDFVFVAMRELLSWPLIGTFVRRGRHALVDRWHLQQSVADATTIEGRLRAKESVLFFPEGGLSRAVGLRPFRMGAFEAAVATGAPVIPVALRGTRQVLPLGTRFPHLRPIHVWIGEPLRSIESGWKAALDLRERAANAVAEHCGEARRDRTATA
jgi:1-acyl-sn-glycerol-3-phosphate acyltransferase